jgi:hypothetical protein
MKNTHTQKTTSKHTHTHKKQQQNTHTQKKYFLAHLKPYTQGELFG